MEMALFVLVVAVLVALAAGKLRLSNTEQTHSPPRSATPAPQPCIPESPEELLASAPDAHSFSIGDLFFAEVARSPNGKFLAGACDHWFSNRGEHRGACALLEGSRVLFKKTIRRANNPHVTNDGMFLVEDWKEDGKLNGALLAFDKTGAELWRRDFKANISDSGLSEDGSRAYVTTCNSDYDAHSGKTFLLDARTGAVIQKDDGWGKTRFKGNSLVPVCADADGSDDDVVHQDPSGPCDKESVEAQMHARVELDRGKYSVVIPRVEGALKSGGSANLADAAQLLAELDGKDDEIPVNVRAKLFRLRGDLAEARDRQDGARIWWERAMALDPKIGVKRKLEKLQGKTRSDG